MRPFKHVLITGATGFVGTALNKRLLQERIRITVAELPGENAVHLPAGVNRVIVAPLSESSDYTTALKDVNIVIHLAARVHVMQESASDPLKEFRKVNLHGTERLALQAAKAGVNRLIFMSTIGVNGNTSGGRAFNEHDIPTPHNSYSVSKFEAEIRLNEISAKTGMEVVILRAPLVYGPGNPGNFLTLLRLVHKGTPLPFASINNKKSFLYVENLADALTCCITNPSAAGQTYLVSDGEDVSTPELIRRIAFVLGKPTRLFPFPTSLMRSIGKLLGKTSTVEQLVGSLQVDSEKIRSELGWKPSFTMEQGLSKTAKWFMSGCNG